MQERRLYSITHAAEVLGISGWTLRKHVALQTIRVVRLGRRVFLPADEVERIVRDGLPSLRVSKQKADGT